MICFLTAVVISIATTIGVPASKVGCNGGWPEVTANTCECA
jgi:hypothetical protein